MGDQNCSNRLVPSNSDYPPSGGAPQHELRDHAPSLGPAWSISVIAATIAYGGHGGADELPDPAPQLPPAKTPPPRRGSAVSASRGDGGYERRGRVPHEPRP